MRKRRVLLTGLPYFAEDLCARMNATDVWEARFLDLRHTRWRLIRILRIIAGCIRADLWYQVGGQVRRGRIFTAIQAVRTTIVVHWAGTDVLHAAAYLTRHPRHRAAVARAVHFAGAPWLKDELESVGLKSEFLPLPLRTVDRASESATPPLPAHFTILTYSSDETWQFYGGQLILRLARELPQVTVLVVGATGCGIADVPQNVEFLGWVDDIESVYTMSTLVVRMTEHDGYGGTVQEALAFGRYAIWSYPFEGALWARDYESMRSHVTDLLDLHENFKLLPNRAGVEHMREHMDSTKLWTAIDKRLREVS